MTRYSSDQITIKTLKDAYGYINYRNVKSKVPEGTIAAYQVMPSWKRPGEVYRFWSLDEAEAAFVMYYNQTITHEVRLQRIAVIKFPDGKYHKVSFGQLTFRDNENKPTEGPQDEPQPSIPA